MEKKTVKMGKRQLIARFTTIYCVRVLVFFYHWIK